ncbi:hypothetical protein RFI_21102, partial [Reticulomyxa filosa]
MPLIRVGHMRRLTEPHIKCGPLGVNRLCFVGFRLDSKWAKDNNAVTAHSKSKFSVRKERVEQKGDKEMKAKYENLNAPESDDLTVRDVLKPQETLGTYEEYMHTQQMQEKYKTDLYDLIHKYDEKYEQMSKAQLQCIESSPAIIAGSKFLYSLKLKNPFNPSCQIHLVGIRNTSVLDQPELCEELKTLLDSTQPNALILQLCKERYEAMMGMRVDKFVMPLSASTVLSPQHFGNTCRIALYCLNYLTYDYRINPFLFAAVHVMDTQKKNDNHNHNHNYNDKTRVLLGDIPISVLTSKQDGKLNDLTFQYWTHTTHAERMSQARMSGLTDLLLFTKSVAAVYEWILLNK